jgi:flagellar motor switch protein FliM
MQLRDDKTYKDLIEIAISKAKIPLRAVLGTSTISVNDFMNIQRGDIIKLNSKVDDELTVYVGNLNKFTALPGASGGTYAVKISSIIHGEE